jgi:hypothetical protein
MFITFNIVLFVSEKIVSHIPLSKPLSNSKFKSVSNNFAFSFLSILFNNGSPIFIRNSEEKFRVASQTG